MPSIFSRFMRHSRDKPINSLNGLSGLMATGNTPSGKIINESNAMQSTAVYACVRILSEAIAALPIHIYRSDKDGNSKRDSSHPLSYLLHNEPNPEMTSFVFREALMGHLLIYGNAYSQIIRNGRGEVTALYPLLPNKMKVSRSNNGDICYSYYRNDDEASPYKPINQYVMLTRNEVLHIPALGFDGLMGYSPIQMARNAIGLALATEDYGAKFFSNSAKPSGVLEHPGSLKAEARENIRKSWQSQFTGEGTHKVAVLEEGLKFHQISIPNEQAQFLETRKFQINEIARLFRIPPHMVGDLDKSSFSNIEQQSLEFVKYSLDPWVIRWEQAFQQALLTSNEKKEYFIRFNLDGLLRGDYESRMKGYATAIQNGIYSVNDIRALENMNPLSEDEGGFLHMVNGTMTELSKVGAAYASNGDISKPNGLVKEDSSETETSKQENSKRRSKKE